MLHPEILETFRDLLEQARATADPEPTAMNLATASTDGRVHARIVLLKGVDQRGFCFFTNYESAKGQQLAQHPQAALTFHWKHLRDGVQVRIEGTVHMLAAEESDAYFASRPRGSQIGAWASQQSRPLADRETFQAQVEACEKRFAGGEVPRPPHWGGYLLEADHVEFWYAQRYRLHTRVSWHRQGDSWTHGLLYP